MDIPELGRFLSHHLSKVISLDDTAFKEGKMSEKESEHDDASAVDIALVGILSLLGFEFRGSVMLGALADDDHILALVGAIEITDLDFEIATQKHIFRLEVQMSSTLRMKVLNTRNHLLEESSGQFIASFDISAV